MKLRAMLVCLLVACGGSSATRAPGPGGGAATDTCQPSGALTVPGKRDSARGVRAGVMCEDGACELVVTREGVTRAFPDEGTGEAVVGARLVDLDGDGADELVVLTTHTQAYGPSGEMEIIERSLTVLDAASLTLRWSSPWSSDPPEPQSAACTSTAELRDEDCDGRRETLVHVHGCDAPMCAGVRAGKPADSDFVRDECGASPPREERLVFRAAEPAGAFAAVGE
jgi:hypothetical protein